MFLIKRFSIVLSVWLCVATLQAQTQFVVVSDYDDTYRITGIHKIPQIYNALFTDKVWAGSDCLFQTFDTAYEALYIVSNSPNMLRKKISRRLNRHGLRPDSVYLYHKEEGLRFDHKLASIRDIAARHPNAKLVLLGDDATADHLVYDSIRSLLPNRVAAIYIRPVYGRNLPSGISVYYTAYEIALHEQAEGRLTMPQTLAVGEAVLAAPNKRLKPGVLQKVKTAPACPVQNAEAEKLLQQIFERLIR